MADNSSIPVAVGNETFANKDIGGVKYPKHISVDSTGAEIVPATEVTLADVKTAVEALAALITGGALTTSLDAGSPGIITTGTPGSPDTTNVLSVQGQASMTPIATTDKPVATANGTTLSRINAAASTNATNLKASAGQIYSLSVYNVAAYTVFLKIYNKASSPTVGTDTPVWTIPIPAGGGFSKVWPMGVPFATGISYAITKLQADSDTTVVVAGDATGQIMWI